MRIQIPERGAGPPSFDEAGCETQLQLGLSQDGGRRIRNVSSTSGVHRWPERDGPSYPSSRSRPSGSRAIMGRAYRSSSSTSARACSGPGSRPSPSRATAPLPSAHPRADPHRPGLLRGPRDRPGGPAQAAGADGPAAPGDRGHAGPGAAGGSVRRAAELAR